MACSGAGLMCPNQTTGVTCGLCDGVAGALIFVYKLLVMNNYTGLRNGLHGGSELVLLNRLESVRLSELHHSLACSSKCHIPFRSSNLPLSLWADQTRQGTQHVTSCGAKLPCLGASSLFFHQAFTGQPHAPQPAALSTLDCCFCRTHTCGQGLCHI